MIMVTPLSNEQKPLTLSVEGMTCAACAARIERVLQKEDSIKNAVVNFPLKKAIVEFNESIDLIPTSGGKFEFYLNGELLYSKIETDRHTEDGEILGLIEKALS